MHKIVFIFLTILYTGVQGCGIMTHIEIGERAATLYEKTSSNINYAQLIRKHQGVFQAGCVFPDAFYSSICFKGYYSSVSEDTHWTPFLNATVTYIRNNYRRPWNESGERLVVFLLGVMQHQVADVLWHSLDVNDGFLKTMAMMNFHGEFSDAHTLGDFGGDVVNAYSLDNNIKNSDKKWYVPIDDLWNIYNEMYSSSNAVPKYVIRFCSFQMFLGRFGERLGVIDTLYSTYASKSPFLLDQLYSYFEGGISDMAEWSAKTWNRTVTMLDQGTEHCSLPKNPVFIRCKPSLPPAFRYSPRLSRRAVSSQSRRHSSREKGKLRNSSVSRKNLMQENFSNQEFVRKAKLEKKLKRKKLNNSTRTRRKTGEVTPLSNYVIYSTQQPYAELGYSVLTTDLNSDGMSDLVVTSPSYSVASQMYIGKVFVIYASKYGLPNISDSIEHLANFSLTGLHNGGRFGESVVALDANKDGWMDLVVSSPSVGRQSLTYNGNVYIYLSDQGRIPHSPTVTINCLLHHCNYGTRLGVGDVNADGFADLLIGSPMAGLEGPQRGMLQVFYSHPSIGTKRILTNNNANLSFHGKQDYEWFGYSHSFKRVGAKEVLAVGAPGFRKCFYSDCRYDEKDKQTVGRVFIYQNAMVSSGALVKEGSDALQQFGSCVRVMAYKNISIFLAISSVTAPSLSKQRQPPSQPGKVELFQLTNLQKLASLQSTEPLARYGHTVIDSSNSDIIYLSAPLLSASFFKQREVGAIFAYEKIPPHKLISKVSLLENHARFGTSITLFESQQKTQLIVGTTHYSSNSTRLAGAVIVANI